MITKEELKKYYTQDKLSSFEVSQKLGCSVGQVNYWLSHYGIPKRSISDSIYNKRNPKGDPFSVRQLKTIEDGILYGLGLGLYWGEGNKRNTNSLRLANTDFRLIKKYIEFLKDAYQIEEKKLKFGLQVFGDIDGKEALNFWIKSLGVQRKQFQKTVYLPRRGMGTYKHRAENGVLIVYFNNKKLRDLICQAIEKL